VVPSRKRLRLSAKEEAHIVVKMRWNIPSRRDLMDINIEYLTRLRNKINQPTLLLRLTKSHGEEIKLPISMPTRLKPAIELAVVKEER
jgi:hypothetical protein